MASGCAARGSLSLSCSRLANWRAAQTAVMSALGTKRTSLVSWPMSLMAQQTDYICGPERATRPREQPPAQKPRLRLIWVNPNRRFERRQCEPDSPRGLLLKAGDLRARLSAPPETRYSSLPNHASHAIWAPGRAYSAAQVDKDRTRVLSARATAAALLWRSLLRMCRQSEGCP